MGERQPRKPDRMTIQARLTGSFLLALPFSPVRKQNYMSFGLLSTEVTRAYESINSRRKIYWQFPQGAAQLMGLLSLLPNSEETDKSLFGWWERRFPTQRTTTVATGTAPFLNGDGTAFADQATMTADVEYIVRVADTSQFKPTHVIEIRDLVYTAAATKNLTGVVTQVISTTQLKFRPNETTAGVENGTTDNVSLTVSIKGTANRENARSGTGIFVAPINPTNRTQIFRSAFNLSRTALKGGLLFDKSGPYQMMAKENGMRHMIEMEKAFLWGQNHEVGVADPDTGDITPETQTGGVIDFLQRWEAVNSIYRGGTGAAAITSNTDHDKRIVSVGGTLTKARYNTWLQDLFRVTQDKGYEKVCLCGATFISTINTLFEKDRVVQTVLTEPSTKARFVVYSHETLFGTVHYKTHPLFTEDLDLTDSGLFLDLGNLRFRPLTDSDTKFLKGRQETDRDGRKDEWITEAGLELKFPESCGYLKDATTAG